MIRTPVYTIFTGHSELHSPDHNSRLGNLSEWKRTVVPGGLQVILPMRRCEKLGEAGILIGKIVLPLQIDAVHLLPYSLEKLC
jgi:hypothetical protein